MSFFDVNVFNPFSKSNWKFSLASCMNHHERSKRRSYESRNIEGDEKPAVLNHIGLVMMPSWFFSAAFIDPLHQRIQIQPAVHPLTFRFH